MMVNIVTMMAMIPGEDLEMADDRKQIQTKIDDLKSQITEQRPLGARIDAARDFLKRARQWSSRRCNNPLGWNII